MRFTWDAKKAAANPLKHPGVTFEMATEVFSDPFQIQTENYFYSDEGEQRMQVIGITGALVLLLVVFVERSADGEETIHIISARKATKYEESAYKDQFSE